MAKISNHREATEAMGAYVFGSDLAPELKEALLGVFAEVSPVKREYDFVETVYANRTGFDPAGLKVAAAVAAFCVEHSFGSLRDERGPLVRDTLLREAGSKKSGGGKWHAASKDPETEPGVFVLGKEAKDPVEE